MYICFKRLGKTTERGNVGSRATVTFLVKKILCSDSILCEKTGKEKFNAAALLAKNCLRFQQKNMQHGPIW